MKYEGIKEFFWLGGLSCLSPLRNSHALNLYSKSPGQIRYPERCLPASQDTKAI